MAFITNNSGTVTSFAEYQDVLDMDQRLFENNEGLTDDIVEDLLTKSTQRIFMLSNTLIGGEIYIYRKQLALVLPVPAMFQMLIQIKS